LKGGVQRGKKDHREERFRNTKLKKKVPLKDKFSDRYILRTTDRGEQVKVKGFFRQEQGCRETKGTGREATFKTSEPKKNSHSNPIRKLTGSG